MIRFQHHPDGKIIIEGAGGLYMDTPENFALDSSTAYPGLPDGVIGFIYEPARVNAYYTKNSQLDGAGDVVEFDAAILNVTQLLTAKSVREAPPLPTPQELKDRAITQINAPILSQMAAVNALILDALGDGDEIKVAEHRATKNALRAQLQ